MAVIFAEGPGADWFRRRSVDIEREKMRKSRDAWEALSKPHQEITPISQAGGGGRAEATVHCEGPATFTAVGDGQAPGVGALYSKYGRFSIRGGGRGTVAVQRNFLGLSKDDLRQYGSRIQVAPADDGLATNTGGPSPPYSVSDFGDRNIQKTPGVAFDVYRWEKATHPLRYGQGHFPTPVTFPEGIGATCPPGWRQW